MLESTLDRNIGSKVTQGEVLIYLLHLQFPAGSCLHYVGSTWSREFSRRMRSHASGYGTSRTAVYYNAGAEFWLVKTWQRWSRDLERVLLKQADLSIYCPICSPPLPLPGAAVRTLFRIDGAPRPRQNSLSLRATS